MHFLTISILLYSNLFIQISTSEVTSQPFYTRQVDNDNNVWICFPEGQATDGLNDQSSERLVVYLYKNPVTEEIKAFVPGRDKQALMPNFPALVGDTLKPVTTEPIASLFNSQPDASVLSTKGSPIGLNKGKIETISLRPADTESLSNQLLPQNQNVPPVDVPSWTYNDKPQYYPGQQVPQNLYPQLYLQDGYPTYAFNLGSGENTTESDAYIKYELANKTQDKYTLQSTSKPETVQLTTEPKPSQAGPLSVKPEVYNPGSANKYLTFDQWFTKQMKSFQDANLPDDVKSIDSDILRSLVQKTLFENQMIIGSTGLITNANGIPINVQNLELRPILIGNSFDYKSLQGNQQINLPQPVPYLEGILVTLVFPPKILGVIPLGKTYVSKPSPVLSQEKVTKLGTPALIKRYYTDLGSSLAKPANPSSVTVSPYKNHWSFAGPVTSSSKPYQKARSTLNPFSVTGSLSSSVNLPFLPNLYGSVPSSLLSKGLLSPQFSGAWLRRSNERKGSKMLKKEAEKLIEIAKKLEKEATKLKNEAKKLETKAAKKEAKKFEHKAKKLEKEAKKEPKKLKNEAKKPKKHVEKSKANKNNPSGQTPPSGSKPPARPKPPSEPKPLAEPNPPAGPKSLAGLILSSGPKPTSGLEPEPGPYPPSGPEPPSETKPPPGPKPTTGPKPKSGPHSPSGPKPDSGPHSPPGLKPKPGSQPPLDPKPESVTHRPSSPKPPSEPKSLPGSKPKSGTHPPLDHKPESEPHSPPGTKLELGPHPPSVPKPDSEPKPQSTPESEPEESYWRLGSQDLPPFNLDWDRYLNHKNPIVSQGFGLLPASKLKDSWGKPSSGSNTPAEPKPNSNSVTDKVNPSIYRKVVYPDTRDKFDSNAYEYLTAIPNYGKWNLPPKPNNDHPQLVVAPIDSKWNPQDPDASQLSIRPLDDDQNDANYPYTQDSSSLHLIATPFNSKWNSNSKINHKSLKWSDHQNDGSTSTQDSSFPHLIATPFYNKWNSDSKINHKSPKWSDHQNDGSISTQDSGFPHLIDTPFYNKWNSDSKINHKSPKWSNHQNDGSISTQDSGFPHLFDTPFYNKWNSDSKINHKSPKLSDHQNDGSISTQDSGFPHLIDTPFYNKWNSDSKINHKSPKWSDHQNDGSISTQDSGFPHLIDTPFYNKWNSDSKINHKSPKLSDHQNDGSISTQDSGFPHLIDTPFYNKWNSDSKINHKSPKLSDHQNDGSISTQDSGFPHLIDTPFYNKWNSDSKINHKSPKLSDHQNDGSISTQDSSSPHLIATPFYSKWNSDSKINHKSPKWVDRQNDGSISTQDSGFSHLIATPFYSKWNSDSKINNKFPKWDDHQNDGKFKHYPTQYTHAPKKDTNSQWTAYIAAHKNAPNSYNTVPKKNSYSPKSNNPDVTIRTGLGNWHPSTTPRFNTRRPKSPVNNPRRTQDQMSAEIGTEESIEDLTIRSGLGNWHPSTTPRSNTRRPKSPVDNARRTHDQVSAEIGTEESIEDFQHGNFETIQHEVEEIPSRRFESPVKSVLKSLLNMVLKNLMKDMSDGGGKRRKADEPIDINATATNPIQIEGAEDDHRDFRIIGGSAATGSGSPLSNKGRSGINFSFK